MYIKCSAYKSYVCFLSLLSIIGFILLYFLGSFMLLVLLCFWIGATIIEYNDYKLILTDKKIEFYSVFRQRKEVELRDITKIKIKRVDTSASFFRTRENIYVYKGNEEYVFKMNRLGNKIFYEDIEALSKIINISYEKQSI